jgi:hypothetical protein
MLALETLKTTLKPQKTQNIIIYAGVRALRHQGCAWRQQLRALRLAPSPGHTSQACCLLSPHQGTPVSCNSIIFKAISNSFFCDSNIKWIKVYSLLDLNSELPTP